MSRSKPAPPPTTTHASALVSPSASLTGVYPIVIGANTIIHLRAKLNSSYGPITIGDGCIIEERAVIGIQSQEERHGGSGVVLGNRVVVQSGSEVQGNIAEGGIVEVGAVVGAGSTIGKVCKKLPHFDGRILK